MSPPRSHQPHGGDEVCRTGQTVGRLNYGSDRDEGGQADLIAPGHPLLDAVIDPSVERHHTNLKHGAVLVDPNDQTETPRLLVALTEEITDGHQPARTVSKRFDFVELLPKRHSRDAGPAPYLDYEPLPAEAEEIIDAFDDPWLARGAEDIAVGWAIENSLQQHEQQVKARVLPNVERSPRPGQAPASSEINYWDTRHAELLGREAAGRTLQIRPETAHKRARDLERRLERRLSELAADERLTVRPPTVAGAALVVPQGLLDRLLGRREEPASSYARETKFVERRAVETALTAERRWAAPTEMPHNNPGYDIRSVAGSPSSS